MLFVTIALAAPTTAQSLKTFVNGAVANATDVNDNFTLINGRAQAAQTSADAANATATAIGASVTPLANAFTLTSSLATLSLPLSVRSALQIRDTSNTVRWSLDEGAGGISLNEVGVGTRMFFGYGGNVGIGTNTPSERLAVVGRSHFSDTGFLTLSNATWPDEDVRIVSTDAQLALYSLQNGNGSGCIVLKEVDTNGVLTNAWTMQRLTNGSLEFCYGTSVQPGGTPVMHFSSGGAVGIGTTNPAYQLEVNGTAGKPGGGSWSSSSDLRLKKNVAPLQGALDTLLGLRGVTFEYNDPEAIHELPGVRTGFIAQEVEAVIPDWVSEGADGMKRVTVRGFEALAVEALRELRADHHELVEQNGKLQRQLEALAGEVAALRAAVAAPAAR